MSEELRFPTPARLQAIKEHADEYYTVDAPDVYDLLAALKSVQVVARIYFDIAASRIGEDEVRRERDERINSFVAHNTKAPNEW